MNCSIGNQISYVGIGSKNAPPSVIETMRKLGSRFAERGFMLRTLGQTPVDLAFIDGCKSKNGAIETWVPWLGSTSIPGSNPIKPTSEAHQFCAKEIHGFRQMQPQSKELQARIANLIYGADLKSEASFIVCWSVDGVESAFEKLNRTGEIASVIEMTLIHRTPIFNFGKQGAMDRMTPLVKKLIAESSAKYLPVIASLEEDPEIQKLANLFGIKKITISEDVVEFH